MQRKDREKQEAKRRSRAMQAFRALLAVREITTIISQRRTKNITRRLWGRGRRMTTMVRAVLTNTKGSMPS